MNLFIYEFMQSIFIKETETNEFITKMINEFNKIDLLDTVIQISDCLIIIKIIFILKQNNPPLFENIVNFDYIVQFGKYKRLLVRKFKFFEFLFIFFFVKLEDDKIKNCDNVQYFSNEYEQLVSDSKELLKLIDEYAKNSDFSIEDAQKVKQNILFQKLKKK